MKNEKRVMKVLDPNTNLMQCTECCHEHYGTLQSGNDREDGITNYYDACYKCINGCTKG